MNEMNLMDDLPEAIDSSLLQKRYRLQERSLQEGTLY